MSIKSMKISNRVKRLIQTISTVIVMLVFLGYPAPNAEEPPKRKAEIIEIDGKGEMKAAGTEVWNPLAAGMEVKSEDLIRVQAGSYVDIGVENLGIRNAIVRICGDSTAKADISPSEIIVSIISGEIVFWAEKAGEELRKFEVRTPNAIIGIEGSQGIVQYNQQADITNSRLETIGGYYINPNTGEGGRLDKGTNYVQAEKKSIEKKKKKIPEIHYWDFTSFQGSYAFAMRGLKRFEVAYAKYSKDYLSGYYKTLIGVTDGQVAVAPYDIGGPKTYEQIMLNAGQQIYMEDRILVAVDISSDNKGEKIEEDKVEDTDSKGKKEEKDVGLELDETLKESQETVP